MQGEVGDAVVNGIDAEVATNGVFLDAAPNVVAQQQALFGLLGYMVCVIVVVGTAEGRYLDDFTSETHMHDAKAPADDARVTEQFAYLLGSGVGRNVEVLGHLAQQGIANAATYQVSTETGIVQAVEHF